MKIAILEANAVNPGDLSWSALEALSQVKVCDRTPAEQLAETIGDAEAIFTSKNKITAEIMDACPKLKYIAVQATGYGVVMPTSGDMELGTPELMHKGGSFGSRPC